MELNIKDRIYIPQILPVKGSFMDFNLKKSISKKIGITDKDKEFYEIVTNQELGSVTWNPEKDMNNPIKVEFTDDELAFLKKSCEDISEQEMPDDFWVTVEKIYNSIP